MLYSWNSFIFVGLGITHPCICHIQIVLQDFFSHSLGNNLSNLSSIRLWGEIFAREHIVYLLFNRIKSWGVHIAWILCPMALARRLLQNFAGATTIPWAQVTFLSPDDWFCSICHQGSLCCSSLCTQKHISYLDWMQFHLQF